MKYIIGGLMLLVSVFSLKAQTPAPGRINLNTDGSHWLQINVLGQAWMRYMEYNPGTTYQGYKKSGGLDLGIRRYRIQMQGQIGPRVYIYSQFGSNNLHASSTRQAGFYALDATADYALLPGQLEMGLGLNGWTGFSRFSAPSVGTILGVDAPLQFQATNDVTDQFVRKLSVYAKGYVGQLEYRLALAQPYDIQQSSKANNPDISATSSFSKRPANLQWNGYLEYHIHEKESNRTPYKVGTYLGEKDLLNIGWGFVYQPSAMWHLSTSADTVTSPLFLTSVDLFYESKLRNNLSWTAYVNAAYTDFGPNYIRELGPMNPGTGNDRPDILNGPGNNYPGYGTGISFFGQLALYIAPSAPRKLAFQPYLSYHHAHFTYLQDDVQYGEAGCSVLIHGHRAKLTVAYQNHPVFSKEARNVINHRSGVVLQYQVSL